MRDYDPDDHQCGNCGEWCDCGAADRYDCEHECEEESTEPRNREEALLDRYDAERYDE